LYSIKKHMSKSYFTISKKENRFGAKKFPRFYKTDKIQEK